MLDYIGLMIDSISLSLSLFCPFFPWTFYILTIFLFYLFSLQFSIVVDFTVSQMLIYGRLLHLLACSFFSSAMLRVLFLLVVSILVVIHLLIGLPDQRVLNKVAARTDNFVFEINSHFLAFGMKFAARGRRTLIWFTLQRKICFSHQLVNSRAHRAT